jgi:predicted MFS family arabinose efflux permease
MACKYFFSAGSLAGAFGGVLAYGIGRMNGIGEQEGWRWIFYLEGIATVVVGALSYFLINDFPSDRPKFLTEHEYKRVMARLQADAGTGGSEHFSWKQVLAALSTWKVYIWSLCYIGILVPFYSLSFFSPTIIQHLGFVNYQAQLLSAPPYVFAFMTTMSTAYLSDKYAHRSMFIVFWISVSIAAYTILITIEYSIVKYIAVILATSGLSPCIATCITFISGNISPHTKRAFALAFMISVGNIGGAISGQLYRTQDAPRFILGHAINLGFCILGLISVVILLFGLRTENRRRDRLYGPTNYSSMMLVSAQPMSNGTEVQRSDIFDLDNEENKRRWGYENMSKKEILDLGDQHAAWRYIL